MFILQDIFGLKWLIQFKDYKYSFNLKNIQFQNKDNKISELKHLSIPIKLNKDSVNLVLKICEIQGLKCRQKELHERIKYSLQYAAEGQLDFSSTVISNLNFIMRKKFLNFSREFQNFHFFLKFSNYRQLFLKKN